MIGESPDADEDLKAIVAIRDGNEAALISLMDRYREPVFRLAYRYTGNATDAQWLTEETFTKVFFNASKFNPRGTVRSWIFAIAANHCRDFLRREKRRRQMRTFSESHDGLDRPPLEETIADAGQDAAQATAGAEKLAEIQRSIEALPEKLRFPFIFCVLEEHSQEEAAAVLKTSRKTVESRIYRARKELQNRLAD